MSNSTGATRQQHRVAWSGGVLSSPGIPRQSLRHVVVQVEEIREGRPCREERASCVTVKRGEGRTESGRQSAASGFRQWGAGHRGPQGRAFIALTTLDTHSDGRRGGFSRRTCWTEEWRRCAASRRGFSGSPQPVPVTLINFVHLGDSRGKRREREEFFVGAGGETLGKGEGRKQSEVSKAKHHCVELAVKAAMAAAV